MSAKPKSEIVPSFKQESENKDILCCKYTPNKQYIITGHTDGIIRVYQTGTGNKVKELVKQDNQGEVAVTSIQFRNVAKTENTEFLCTYTNGKVVLWDYEKETVVKEIVERRQPLSSLYHPKLAKFITVGDNAVINLYDEATMQLENTYEQSTVASVVDGHTSRVFAAAFHPITTTEFVTGGWDNVVHFWDMRQTNSMRFIKGVHMCGEGLDISRSGRELLTCSYSRENALQLWHYQTGRLLASIEPDVNKPMLYCGRWISPDFISVGGTDPNLLRVVSMKTLTTWMTYKGVFSGVYCIDHCVKTSRGASKKDIAYDVKIAFSIDKTLIETEVTV